MPSTQCLPWPELDSTSGGLGWLIICLLFKLIRVWNLLQGFLEEGLSSVYRKGRVPNLHSHLCATKGASGHLEPLFLGCNSQFASEFAWLGMGDRGGALEGGGSRASMLFQPCGLSNNRCFFIYSALGLKVVPKSTCVYVQLDILWTRPPSVEWFLSWCVAFCVSKKDDQIHMLSSGKI